MSAIVQAVANTENEMNNCILLSTVLSTVDGKGVLAYVIYVNGSPVDHTVSFDRAMNWYEKLSPKVANPVEVVEITRLDCGEITVKETR